MAYIINIDTCIPINPANLFGKEGDRLLQACENAFQNSLIQKKFRECYRSPSRPTISEIRKNRSENDNFRTAYVKAMKQWERANPEEVAKEQHSLKNWEENNRNKQFRIIYGIARRYGCYLKWHGNDKTACCPDQWSIYKNHECIARICCM